MSTINEIVLQQGVPQMVSVSLSGAIYNLTFQYRNDPASGWVLDIEDANGNALLTGVPLVTGANLLEQYQYLGLGGGLYVQSLGDPDAVPTFDNLGGDGKVYWVTSP